MKRFNVTMKDGTIIPLYYVDMDTAWQHNPDAVRVEEHIDMAYMEYVNRMLDSADRHKTVERRGSTVHLLQFNTSAGICLAWLFQDITDGVFYDFCEHQLWASGRLVDPITRTMCNPKEFCQQFLFPKAEYTVLCAGGKSEVKKPEALRGIGKFASVSFEGMCQCQLFLNSLDLYIKHGDYFSPEYCKPEDCGTPLLYRLKKYGLPVNKKEKFIYADCWGAIVLRRIAWIRISNFVPLVRHLNNREVAATVWPMIRSYHHWRTDEQNEEWEQFLEAVASATRKEVFDNE